MLTKSCIVYSELTPQTHDITCSKYKRCGEDIGDNKLAVEDTHPVKHLRPSILRK